MTLALGSFLFIFGASIGSFINVVLDRYNTGLKFWLGKSFCFSCNNKLERKDMFPIVSFLFLRGKCRNCGSRIPYESFVIELIMSVLSTLLVFKLGFLNYNFFIIQSFISYLILLSIFATIILISFYDLRHMIIPDSFLIIFLVLSFLYNLLPIVLGSSSFKLLAISLLTNVLAGIFLTLPFLILFIISKGRWMGFGDIKYIAIIGFFLGIVNGASAVVLSFWIGAFVSVLLLLVPKILTAFGLSNTQNKFKMNSAIPFGPFLSLGVLISFYLNVDILQIQILKELFFAIFQ